VGNYRCGDPSADEDRRRYRTTPPSRHRTTGRPDVTHDIWERIRYARDAALEAERTERRRLAEADSADLQQAASVRLATRQAVREALDDILDETSDPDHPAA
jgi:hypothetical protein